MFLRLWILNLLVLLAAGKPNGAPGCKVNVSVITAGMGPPRDLGYSLVVTKKKETVFDVSLKNSKNRDCYQGILLYVTTLENTNIHYGKFSFKNTQKWKFQKDACEKAKVNGPIEATVTHANPSKVPLNVTFTWTAKDEREAMMDGLIVSAAVATTDLKGKPIWQKLEFADIGNGFPLDCVEIPVETPSFPTAPVKTAWMPAYVPTPTPVETPSIATGSVAVPTQAVPTTPNDPSSQDPTPVSDPTTAATVTTTATATETQPVAANNAICNSSIWSWLVTPLVLCLL